MLMGLPILLLALLALSAIGLTALFVHRLFLSPLARARLPGPWYAAISDLWLISHVLRLRRCRAIDSLLDVYGGRNESGKGGKIVRVAPNMVVFLDVEERKRVYGVSARLEKSTFYKCLTMCVDLCLFFSVL